MGPALCTGNVLIIKPAEQTPLSILRVGELAIEAGFPPGVLQILPGYGPTAGTQSTPHIPPGGLVLVLVGSSVYHGFFHTPNSEMAGLVDRDLWKGEGSSQQQLLCLSA